MTLSTLGELREEVESILASIGDDFTQPNDDWDPMLLLQSVEGDNIIVPLPMEMFANGRTKDMLAWLMKEAMPALKIIRYALVLGAHMKVAASREEFEQARDEHKRIEHMEGSEEILTLTVGDAEEEHTRFARIQRDGVNPPTLAEWEDIPEATYSGRFVGLNEAMSRIS